MLFDLTSLQVLIIDTYQVELEPRHRTSTPARVREHQSQRRRVAPSQLDSARTLDALRDHASRAQVQSARTARQRGRVAHDALRNDLVPARGQISRALSRGGW